MARVTGYVNIKLQEGSPKIINGYWHEWDGEDWVNTGVKASGEDGFNIYLGISSYGFSTENNRAVAQTVDLTIFCYKGGVRQNIPASDISNPTWVPYGMNFSKSENNVSIIATTDWAPIREGTTINVTFEGKVYILNFRWYPVPIDKAEDGRGVVSIIEQYYLSNSNSSTTGGSWQNTVPVWTEGKYIWTSSLITYSDSPTPERVGITLVPSLSGAAIVSVDVQYARSQSRSIVPSSGWTTNSPASQKGWYIWSRTKIVYSNGVTKYTNEACISGWDGDKGEDGEDGDGFLIRFIRSEEKPERPTTGIKNPTGWSSEIDNPDNLPVYDVTSMGGDWMMDGDEYKSASIGHNGESFFKIGFATAEPTTVKIQFRVSSEANYDKLFIGKLDQEIGENNENALRNISGTQTITESYYVASPGVHFVEMRYKKDGSGSTGSDAGFVKIDVPAKKVWMITCEVIAGVMGVWSDPNLHIDYGQTEASYLTQALKQMVEEKGGLLLASVMAVREADGQVRAYVNGDPNYNNIAFAAGVRDFGTVAEKQNVAIRHDGTAEIGVLHIDAGGRVIIIDPATGNERFVINAQSIPLLADLLSSTNFGKTTTGSAMTTAGAEQYLLADLAGSNSVTKDGSSITVTASSLGISATITIPPQTPESTWRSWFCATYLVMYRNGAFYRTVDFIQNDLEYAEPVGGIVEVRTVSKSINKTMYGLPQGDYTFKLESRHYGNVTSRLMSISSHTLSWEFNQSGIRRQQYGLDGMMFFFSQNHFHFTESGGMDMRGKTNMPGVLLSGTVNSGGGGENMWGAKKSATSPARNSTGRYTVYHSVGHNKYQVSASPISGNRTYYIVSKSNTNFVIQFYTVSSSPSLSDTKFDFQITGDNYS